MRIQWSDDLKLGILEMDEQHRRLIDLLNEFYDAVEHGSGEEGMDRLLQGLEQYTIFHFCAEEHLLAEINYPDLENHRKIHQIMVDQVKSARARYQEGDRKAIRELSAMALGWLYSHILKTDRKYSNYCKDHNIADVDSIAKTASTKC